MRIRAGGWLDLGAGTLVCPPNLSPPVPNRGRREAPEIQRRPAAPDQPARGRLGPARAPGSTGWPRPARRGGRSSRSARRTGTARRTRPTRRSRRGTGSWRTRRAGARRRTRTSSESATRSGSRAGRRYAGPGAVAAQVRFDREWGALRAYAAERGVRLIGDVPIYVAPGGADHRAGPSCSRTGRWRAPRPTRSRPRASTGATRSTTGPRCGGAATAGGSSACGARSTSSTSRASTTSAASCPTGRCPRTPRTARRRAGGAGRAGRSSRRAAPRSASCRSSPRTSASSPLR